MRYDAKSSRSGTIYLERKWPLYEITDKAIKSIAQTTEKGLFERYDLQRLLRDSIETLCEIN